jgi:hypothetical protein
MNFRKKDDKEADKSEKGEKGDKTEKADSMEIQGSAVVYAGRLRIRKRRNRNSSLT